MGRSAAGGTREAAIATGWWQEVKTGGAPGGAHRAGEPQRFSFWPPADRALVAFFVPGLPLAQGNRHARPWPQKNADWPSHGGWKGLSLGSAPLSDGLGENAAEDINRLGPARALGEARFVGRPPRDGRSQGRP